MVIHCSHINNSKAVVNASVNAYAFNECGPITGCIGTGIGTTGYAYYTCGYGSCNINLNSTTAATGGVMTKWSTETND